MKDVVCLKHNTSLRVHDKDEDMQWTSAHGTALANSCIPVGLELQWLGEDLCTLGSHVCYIGLLHL